VQEEAKGEDFNAQDIEAIEEAPKPQVARGCDAELPNLSVGDIWLTTKTWSE